MPLTERSPAISDRDPLEVIRSAAGQARLREIEARADLASKEIIAEAAPGTLTRHLEPWRERHAEADRIRRRWQRALAVMEGAALLGELHDDE